MNQQYEDVYGNVFSIDRELSSGGQGIVYPVLRRKPRPT